MKIILRTLACTMTGSEKLPHISFRRGKRNKRAVTVADTGFPGKHRKYFFLSRNVHVANVVGFPGFIFTRPKRTYLIFCIKKHVF